MAYIQKLKIPENKTETFTFRDFSGGMNNRSDQIYPNEGSIVQNLSFADEIIMETRYGQKYMSEKEYEGEIVFIDEYKPYKEENQLVVGTTKKIYIGDKVMDTVGKPSGTNFQGKYYFSDGNTLMVYGKYHFPPQIKNPEYVEPAEGEEATHPEFIDGEVEDSTYEKYIGTAIDDYIFYKIVTPPEEHDQLPIEHVKGVRVVDYTNAQVYYEPCLNEFSDALKAPNVVPDSVKYVVTHNSRLIVSGHNDDDDNVFMSDVQNALYFPVALPIQVPPTSDRITALHVFDNSLIIGRQDDIYVIRGTTNRPESGAEKFSLHRINTHTGIASHTAVNIAHNYLIFLGSDGNVYSVRSAKVAERDLATNILSRNINLNYAPLSINRSDYKDAYSHFNNDEWYLSVGGKTLVYSYRHMAWTTYTAMDAKSIYSIDGEWLWGNGKGRLCEWDKETYLDYGYPYESIWQSGLFDMKDANSFKQFREFYIVAHTFEETYSDIYVTFEVDYTDTKDRYIISNQISRWGQSRFGDRFITRNINESIPFVIGKRGRNIRVRVKNGYLESGVVPTIIDEEANVDNLLNFPGKRDGTLVKVEDEGIYYLYMDNIWIPMSDAEMNQKMKVYQINGDYELRGKR